MNEEEVKKEDFSDNLSDNDILDEYSEDETDPAHLKYLQDQFQDETVDQIFENVVKYIDFTALPICEFLTKESVEEIIDSLQGC